MKLKMNDGRPGANPSTIIVLIFFFSTSEYVVSLNATVVGN